ncbi:MAG: GAF domain-containing sensor histidine kinase [Chloroflexi bacterium]|nr:GAF domain-containing sensor histidine kinase [Chloroflexota bacterium]
MDANVKPGRHDAILADIARLSGSHIDLDGLLERVAELAARMTGADRSSIFLLDRSGEILHPAAFFGMTPDFTASWKTRPLRLADEPLSSEALLSRRAVAVPDAMTDPRTNKASVAFFGDKSILVAPLVTGFGHRERISGTLFLNHVTSPYRFTSRDIETAEAIGSQIAISIENARLSQDTRRLAGQLRRSFLHAGETLTMSMGANANLLQLLQRMLDLAAELVDADGGTLSIRDDLARSSDVVATTQRRSTGDYASLTGDTTAVAGLGPDAQASVHTDGLVGGLVSVPIHGRRESIAHVPARTTGDVPSEAGASPLDEHDDPFINILSDMRGARDETPPNASSVALGTLTVWRDGKVFDRTEHALLGSVAGYAGVAIEQRRLVQTMNEERSGRLKAERRQAEFISMVSHELRTPLALIKGYSATLQRRDLSLPVETIDRFHVGIGEATDRLIRLIDNLLTASALESGSFITRTQLVDVVEVIRVAVNEMVILDISHTIHADLPETQCLVWGDPDQLAQVIQNLLGNAMKYSSASNPVGVTAIPRPGWVRIAIRDTGPGIPPSAIDAIFDKFFRVPITSVESSLDDLAGAIQLQGTAPPPRPTGLGLGLFICREIVTSHRGRIWAENIKELLNDGKSAPVIGQHIVGTAFHIDLPTAHGAMVDISRQTR